MKYHITIILMFVLVLSGCSTSFQQDKDNMITWMITDMPFQTNNDYVVYCNTIENRVNDVLKQKKIDYQVDVISSFYPEDKYIENDSDFWSGNDALSHEELLKLKSDKSFAQAIKNGYYADLYSLSGSSASNEYSALGYALKNNLLVPLNDLYKRNSDILASIMTEYDLELATFDDKLVGFASQNGPFYEKNKFLKVAIEAIGVSYNDLPTNYEGLVGLMKKYKEKTGFVPYPMYNYDFDVFMEPVYLEYPNCGIAWTKETGYTKITELPQFKEAVERIQYLYKQGYIKVYSDYNAYLMIQNKLIEQSRGLAFIDNEDDLNKYQMVSCDMYPMLSLRYGENITGISSNTKKKEFAEDFLLRLMSDQDIIHAVAYGVEGKDYNIQNNRLIHSQGDVFYFLHDELDSKYVNRKLLFDSQNDVTTIYQNTKEYQKKYIELFPKNKIRLDHEGLLDNIEACVNVIEGYDDTKIMQKMFTTEIEDIDAYIQAIEESLEQAGINEIIESYTLQEKAFN